MKRVVYFGYGITCYLMFFCVYAYMAGFVGNFLVPKSIDSLPRSSATGEPIGTAVAIDVGLLLLFALQHSVMARAGFKEVWTKIVPRPIERSTYVLLSNLALILLMWQWRPLPAVVWDASGVWRYLLWTLFAAGWLLVPVASLMISHFDLFGVRQVWLNLQKKQYTALPFHTPLLYGVVRHPLYVGWFMALCITPTMSVGHALFAGALSAYIVLASKIEERDLANYFGHEYEDYQRRVPAFMPRIGRRKNVQTQPIEAAS